jgi:hypothetical protein
MHWFTVGSRMTTSSTYFRTNVFLTVNGNNYPTSLSTPAPATFTFGPADHGRLDEVDLAVTVTGFAT